MLGERYNWDFFIAHAGTDTTIAEDLYDLLAPKSKVFLDSKNLMLGDNWDKELLSAQNSSLISVILVSSSTERAYYQKEEIASAIDLARHDEDQHRIVPVFLDAGARDNSQIPYGLRRKHGLTLSGSDDLAIAADRLIELLSKIKQKETLEKSKVPIEKPSIQDEMYQHPNEVAHVTGQFRPDFLTLYLRLSSQSSLESNSYRLGFSIPDRDIYLEDIPVTLNLNDLLPLTLDPDVYGLKLAELLFQNNDAKSFFNQLVGESKSHNRRLRVRLRIDPTELINVYWELLRYPSPSAWLPHTVIPSSRFLPTKVIPAQHEVLHSPLRVLVVIASPNNLNQYKLSPFGDPVYQNLHTIFDGLPNMTVTYLASETATPPTLQRIYRALIDGVDIVHLLCHVRYTINRDDVALFLEKDDGTVDVIRKERLVSLFQKISKPPKLCFLEGCETMAIGYNLVTQSEILAAVAMNELISPRTAMDFTSQFYSRLLEHGALDLAMSEARGFIAEAPDAHQPVLLSRLPNNILFEV
ncbi:MAG TPA: TIR domain-containing protein [Caldilineaceae bacterium]|nr:TIR domain-containing protein [Caldilineaceae bacterium]